MKKKFCGLMVSLLFMTLALPACTRNWFPTGQFSNLSMNHCVLKLNKNHTWTNEVYGVIVGSGTYSPQGDEFTLHMDHVNLVSGSNAFTYKWSYEDNILTLTFTGKDGHPEQFRNMKADLELKNLYDLKSIGITQQISKLFHILHELVKPLTFIHLR